MTLVSIGVWYWSIRNDIDRAKNIIDAHDRISQLAIRSKNDGKGHLIIDFTEAKGDSVKRFWEYSRIDKRTIRIVIGEE
jgi:hypothetical protein